MSGDEAERTVRAFVRGRVQKVGYRAWVNAHAVALGLRGFVRNRSDGSVEAVFCGDPDRVAQIAESLLRGPPKAAVTGVEITEETQDALAETFGAHFVVLPTR
ncbi:MAG: acylphosphatase [Beijerinckiaceae bacterium]